MVKKSDVTDKIGEGEETLALSSGGHPRASGVIGQYVGF